MVYPSDDLDLAECALIRMGGGSTLRLWRRWRNGVRGGQISLGGLGMGGGEALLVRTHPFRDS